MPRAAGVDVRDKLKGTAEVALSERCNPAVRRIEDRAEEGRGGNAWGGEDDRSAETSSALPSKLKLIRTLLFDEVPLGARSLLKLIGNGQLDGVGSASGRSLSPGVMNPPFWFVEGVMNLACAFEVLGVPQMEDMFQRFAR